MSFLVPAFLGALAALSIPVLIHMINRERKVVVEFPSLMFIHKIPYRSVRRQKIRHLLLLLLRCLALAVIVAAFARPFFEKPKDAIAATTGAREIVIAIDQSYSMAYGNRWKRAQDAARKVVGEISGNDRVTIILFAAQPSLRNEPTADKSRLEGEIARAKVTAEGTRFVSAIKLGGTVLDASSLPRKELILISDYQRAGWAKREEVTLPPGVVLKPVDVGEKTSSDAAVVSVTAKRDDDSTRAHVRVSARVTNVGAKERTTDAVLDIGGRAVESKRITIPAKGATQVSFSPAAVPGSATRGIVRIGADSLPPDDKFHFTISPNEEIAVLIVEPAGARPNLSLFLNKAFETSTRPKFKVNVTHDSELEGTDFDNRSLVIFNEATPPAGALGARLRDMVNAGTGVLIVPGMSDTERWPAEWRTYLPATIGGIIDRVGDREATFGKVDVSNPLFEIFSAAGSGDFSSARVFKYKAIVPKSDSGVSVIARFDDGAPAMVEGTKGAGKVVVWATTLDADWTDLPRSHGAVYVPFVFQLGRHIGRFTDPRQFFTVGDALDLSRHAEMTEPLLGKGARPANDSGELVLQTPTGDKVEVSVKGTNRLARLGESGFYELRGPKTPVGGGRPIAVNVDASEADLTHLDPAELVAAATKATGNKSKTETNLGTPEEQERRQTVWWYLLLGALFVLAVETVMSNRLSRAVSI
jgi:hypothetical protein